MPKPSDLAHRIQSLVASREEYVAAIADIDETLSRVAGALNVNDTRRKYKTAKGIRSGKRKRTRRKFAMSGEQSILAFVKSRSNPVGSDIQKNWDREGRAGAAANLMSKLVKAKQLKRTPLKDGRGSRYSLA
jgi:hypothetical protein